jgi:GNAT superfamily N-acetyltransferase
LTIDPVVRPATLDQLEQLRELEAEARDLLTGQRGGPRWLATNPAHSWRQAIEGGAVHVAVIDDVVVGYLVSSRDGEVARIDDVYVTSDARQVGFGDALVEAAVAQARAAGCSSIESHALPGDRETKNLFERAGITARLIIVAKSLRDVVDG